MNDIEKKLRKRGMQKLDKFAKNPYKVHKLPWYKRIPTWTKVAIPTLSGALAVCCAIILLMPALNGAKGNAASKPNKDGYSGAPSQASSKQQGDASYASSAPHDPAQSETGFSPTKFETVVFNNLTYSPAHHLDGKYEMNTRIDSTQIESLVGTIKIYEGETRQQIVPVYKIKHFSTEVTIAIENYVYYNYDYTSTSIYDFLEDFSYNKNLVFTGVQVIDSLDNPNPYTVKNYRQEEIESLIYYNAAIPNTYETIGATEYEVTPIIDITVSLPTLKIDNYKIFVYSNGVLKLGNGNNLFDIGETKYQELKDYLDNHL